MNQISDARAISETINLIQEEKSRLVERALEEQRKVAPSTTPTKYNINTMVGSSNLRRMMLKAALDHTSGKELDGKREDIIQEAYEDYSRYLSGLIFHYLESKGVEIFEDEVPPLTKQTDANFMQKLKEAKLDWDTSLEDNPPRGVSEKTESSPIIWIYYFPYDERIELEDKIENRLLNLGVRQELASTLGNFPKGLQTMTGKSIENMVKNDSHRYTQLLIRKVLNYIEDKNPKYSFEEFNNTLLHEITHDYLKRKSDNKSRLRTVDEAFAQFTDSYYREGIDFDHSPSSYEYYRKYYDNADPEDIWWMVEIIREKAKEFEVGSSELSVIDWARMSEVKIHNQDITSRIQFLEFFTPDKLQQELVEFDSIIKEDMAPLLDRISGHLQEKHRFWLDENISEKQEEHLKKIIEQSEIDRERIEQVEDAPDETLRKIEAKTVREHETFGYESKIILEVIENRIGEINKLIEDLEKLAKQLDELETPAQNRVNDLIKDIEHLSQLKDELKNLYSR